ncbi:hypothetical protein [uncultured Eubacterium sp.]|uniref:hypothetical protein n=1 Tax=uncultured Eubacterium sp. TaxID=165185 RepID=UPI00259A2BAA|nr:hypothetical protein [uncultured Eubacterium sp.]
MTRKELEKAKEFEKQIVLYERIKAICENREGDIALVRKFYAVNPGAIDKKIAQDLEQCIIDFCDENLILLEKELEVL